MTLKARKKTNAPSVILNSDVLRRIRQHARSESKTEVCGVLIGREEKDGKVAIEACIAGVNATQAGTHVTFTQDTWEHIYKIKDKEYPEDRILGWYHSHPGFGVFLSDHDTFIHKNFFSSHQQIAWVYDPHSDEEGCFGWVGNHIERLPGVAVSDSRGGEQAGETGKPEPFILQVDDEPVKRESHPVARDEEPPWLRWTASVLLNLSIFACGVVVAWVMFPRVVVMPVPVDPQTGKVIQSAPDQTNQRKEQPSRTGSGAENSSHDGSKPPGDPEPRPNADSRK